jgi:hypothetical protein
MTTRDGQSFSFGDLKVVLVLFGVVFAIGYVSVELGRLFPSCRVANELNVLLRCHPEFSGAPPNKIIDVPGSTQSDADALHAINEIQGCPAAVPLTAREQEYVRGLLAMTPVFLTDGAVNKAIDAAEKSR